MKMSIKAANGAVVEVDHEELLKAVKMLPGKHEATDSRYYDRAVKNICELTGCMPENEDEFKLLIAKIFFDGNVRKADLAWELMEACIGMAKKKMDDAD